MPASTAIRSALAAAALLMAGASVARAAMALGQLAGMVSPLVLLGVGVWGACALIGRKS